MSSYIEKSGKNITSRSIYIKILIFLFLIGLSAIALKPLQNIIGETIAGIRTNLIGRLETYTGMEIRYSSIRPSFFNSFDIRNIKFIKDENEILTISRARIYFSLRELLLRKKTVINIIQIDRPQLHLDMKRDRDIFEHFKSLSDSNNGGKLIFQEITEFLPEKTNYRIRNLSFSISSGESIFIADNTNVNITRDKNRVLLDTTSGIEIVYSGFFGRTIAANTVMKINGEYLTELQEGRGEIAFSQTTFRQQNIRQRPESFLSQLRAASFINSAVTTSENTGAGKPFSVNPFAVNFSYREKTAVFSSLGENNGNNYFVSFDTENHAADALVNLNGFIPSSLLSRSDNSKDLISLLDMAITGKLSLNYKNLHDFNYSVLLQSGNVIKTWQEGSALSNAFLINAAGSSEHAVINDFYLNASSGLPQGGFQGIVSYTGSLGFSPFKPSGTVNISRLSFTGKESLSGVFNVSGSGNDIAISGEKISAGSFSPKTLDIYLHPSGSDIGVRVSSLCNDGGDFSLDAIINKSSGLFETSLFFNSFRIVNVAEAFRPFVSFINIPSVVSAYSDSIKLDAEIFISANNTNFAYNVPSVILRDDNPICKLSISGTDRVFSLTEGVFYLNRNELVLSANADFSNPMDLDFSLNAKYLDTPWNIKGQIFDRTTLIVQDPGGLNIYGSKSSSGAISGYIEGVNFPVPADDYPAYTDFYITLRYNSKDFWTVDISHLKVKELNSGNGPVILSVSGLADQDGASLRDFSYNDSIGLLAGNADFFWNTDFSSFDFLVNLTDGTASGESYSMNGALKDNNIGINASLSNVRIDRYVKGNGAILASADAKFSWNSIDSFTAEIDLSSFDAKYRAKQINVSGKTVISNSELLAENLKLDFAGIKTVFPVFYLKPKEGIARINTSLNGFAGKKDVEGSVDLQVDFNSVESWVNIKQALNSIDGKLQIDNFKFGSLSKEKTVFVFSGNEGAFSISGGEKDMLMVEMDREGNFYASLSDPLPIRGSFAGVFKDFTFDAYCSNYYIDMASLWEVANNAQEDFNISGGYITGKMNLRGEVWNPEFFGTGVCTSLRLQVPEYMAEDIRAVPFNILAEGYEMAFGPVEAVSGGGSGTVNGWFRFEFWAPRNIGLDITVPREKPVPYNIGIAGFYAGGKASGRIDLSLNSNDKVLEIKGNLYVNDTEMVVNANETSFGSGFSSDSLYNTAAELSITTGPMVEFFWPSINSPILRVSPEVRTVFKISADMQAGYYSIASDIKIRSGELYYLDRNFYIRSGNLILNENERQFDPILNVRAEIRDRSDSGPVTIAMIIENQPLLSFVPRFEATPSLTQLEIYSILGQNSNIQNNENPELAQRFLLATSTNLMAQLVSGSPVLSQLNFVRQLERGARTFLHLDMLSIRTRLIENAVVSGANVLGSSSVDRMGRVGNYFDNTTVSIGKYVGQDMFIHGSLALRYDENHPSFGGLRFEPDIGIELQNPYFNIRWSFFPYNPRNWWMTDHSITLFWSRSFK